MKWLSDLSGDSPHGGRLAKVMIRAKVHWRLEDLQAYTQERERVRLRHESRKEGLDGS